MGILERMSTLLRVKMNAVLDGQPEGGDLAETLDLSYEKQVQLLQDVKRGIVDVVTSKRRLELQAARLRDSAGGAEAQARKALNSGREDLARAALQRQTEIEQQAELLQKQIDQLQAEREKLTLTEQRLQTKIEAFRSRKETIRARYSAAEAQVKIGEAASGIGEEMADVGMAIEHAERRTKELELKAAAIDEMVAEGALPDFSGLSQDPLDKQLRQLEVDDNVERRLEALRAEVRAELPSGEAG